MKYSDNMLKNSLEKLKPPREFKQRQLKKVKELITERKLEIFKANIISDLVDIVNKYIENTTDKLYIINDFYMTIERYCRIKYDILAPTIFKKKLFKELLKEFNKIRKNNQKGQ